MQFSSVEYGGMMGSSYFETVQFKGLSVLLLISMFSISCARKLNKTSAASSVGMVLGLEEDQIEDLQDEIDQRDSTQEESPQVEPQVLSVNYNFDGSGGSGWQHQVSFVEGNLSAVTVVTSSANSLLNPAVVGDVTHVVDFNSLSIGQCNYEFYANGTTVSTNRGYRGELIFCKVDSQTLNIGHRVKWDDLSSYNPENFHDYLIRLTAGSISLIENIQPQDDPPPSNDPPVNNDPVVRSASFNYTGTGGGGWNHEVFVVDGDLTNIIVNNSSRDDNLTPQTAARTHRNINFSAMNVNQCIYEVYASGRITANNRGYTSEIVYCKADSQNLRIGHRVKWDDLTQYNPVQYHGHLVRLTSNSVTVSQLAQDPPVNNDPVVRSASFNYTGTGGGGWNHEVFVVDGDLTNIIVNNSSRDDNLTPQTAARTHRNINFSAMNVNQCIYEVYASGRITANNRGYTSEIVYCKADSQNLRIGHRVKWNDLTQYNPVQYHGHLVRLTSNSVTAIPQ